MTRPALTLLLVTVLALAGCGLHDPYAPQPSGRSGAVRAGAAQASSPQGSRTSAGDASSVLARYARTWGNWSAATLASQRAALLALAGGRLASELRRDAAQAAKTQLQEASGAYSRGHYVGVIPGEGGRAIVVTYEEATLLGGQAQGAYHVYLARTQRTPAGWRVCEWQPASES